MRDHAFHGLTMGALSLNGNEEFRGGFGPLLEDCEAVEFGDLAALERAARSAATWPPSWSSRCRARA